MLRIAVDYDDRRVQVSIVDSQGLLQTADRIHRKAAGWILEVERRIAQELQRLALFG